MTQKMKNYQHRSPLLHFPEKKKKNFEHIQKIIRTRKKPERDVK